MSPGPSKSSNDPPSRFFPITKSNSVPDIHKNVSDTLSLSTDSKNAENELNFVSNSIKKDHNLILNNQSSIESSSPSGSLEQFDVNANISLSPNDANDSISDPIR